ncbi:NACHT domain-containing NTPase [Paenibacillus sp. N3.4]|uniref:NACHT domain-containing protein n=1 Tax=Paenibacillus sp. N3.4 TaxID=2603222 RepID=UPI0011C70039|nr:hypothetical protein [Paenibacillus sp. N3.4]TXK79117.1 hypothetical protein FU659_20105 [Paenibacillus sp. N3.4]
MFPDITKLIVKIKIPNGQATGMLISLPDNTEEDLVITVFHLFDGFSGDMNNIGLEAWSGRTDLFTITRLLYERSSRDQYDIAFIFVKKLTWLQPDDNMVIPNGDGNLLYSEVLFAGYPKAIEALDLPFLPLEGKIQGYNDEKKSKWMVKLSEPSEPDTYLYEAIVGMSGCPMYTHRNGRFYFLGMQKNVPSQEKSYYITNVLTYDWCIRAAFELYGIKLPWQNEDLDASYIKNRRLFKEYQGKAKQQAGTYYLDSLNDQLFPKMVNDKGETFGAEGEASLLTYLRNSWVGSVSLCKSLLITGEGGTGKTVSLLSTCDYVLEQNIFAAYIPMVSLETGTNAPIKNYLVEYIWQGDQEQADLFFRIGQQHSRDGKPSLLLFLDGMNELPEDSKKMVVQEIDQWTKKSGVQLIVTSRTNFKYHYGWLSQLEHLRLESLDQRQISNYLISLGLEIPSENKTLMNLLEIPMLLTLYANTEAQYNQFKSTVGLFWYHDRVNTGALIWNYFQCQFGKVMSIKFDGPEILAYLYALEFVTPFIGFRFEAESLYLIDEDRFYALINEANTYYQALWCGGIPSRISSLARQYSCMSKPWEDPQRQYRILIQELHLFHLRADNKVSFMHQQFRDFFSAVHYIELLRNDSEFTQFARRPIDYYVLNFLTDLLEEAIVQRAWGFMGGSHEFLQTIRFLMRSRSIVVFVGNMKLSIFQTFPLIIWI